MDIKITRIKFNNFYNLNTVYMLFYKRRIWWKHLKDIGLIPMDDTCWVSWYGIETPYSIGSSWRLLVSSLTFINFCCFSHSLTFVSSWFLCLLISILFRIYIWHTVHVVVLLQTYMVCLLLCDGSFRCKKDPAGLPLTGGHWQWCAVVG